MYTRDGLGNSGVVSRPKRWNMFGLGGYGGSMAAKSRFKPPRRAGPPEDGGAAGMDEDLDADQAWR